MTIDTEQDQAVRDWMEEQGWKGTEAAIWQSEPDVGFWAWRHHEKPRNPTILAIHEAVLRNHPTGRELVAHLRLIRVVDDLRREGQVRVWERGRITKY